MAATRAHSQSARTRNSRQGTLQIWMRCTHGKLDCPCPKAFVVYSMLDVGGSEMGGRLEQ